MNNDRPQIEGTKLFTAFQMWSDKHLAHLRRTLTLRPPLNKLSDSFPYYPLHLHTSLLCFLHFKKPQTVVIFLPSNKTVLLFFLNEQHYKFSHNTPFANFLPTHLTYWYLCLYLSHSLHSHLFLHHWKMCLLCIFAHPSIINIFFK